MNGKKSAPENKENRRELRDFNARQRLALSILYLNISTEYRSIIENVTDPAEAWKLLRNNFRSPITDFIICNYLANFSSAEYNKMKKWTFFLQVLKGYPINWKRSASR
ncbi:hypothetical protein TNCT_689471 [Trichonephila clavata]|uniref:Uncharacterized protein n=1 Tax=Trichonephila clavata TaxID=2740835 RepID=A0A8X6LT51_TRICU|nr:hypothetical protein TNCT_689471 [Trichonephila clavata]